MGESKDQSPIRLVSDSEARKTSQDFETFSEFASYDLAYRLLYFDVGYGEIYQIILGEYQNLAEDKQAEVDEHIKEIILARGEQ